MVLAHPDTELALRLAEQLDPEGVWFFPDEETATGVGVLAHTFAGFDLAAQPFDAPTSGAADQAALLTSPMLLVEGKASEQQYSGEDDFDDGYFAGSLGLSESEDGVPGLFEMLRDALAKK